ncbi:sensor histidine kinase [Peptostreptococcus canis]|uniref:histidine kinase n=1 Tax=Peptostreptococcus canis TaxID=1159213 RepID=A0ABR6TL28_9FIRM|nr:HAMP domain-containing sensor histidine kinase [Peptostreptococcus canis]MBC2575696.1 HAMP domain-containing histidine kinase [Peptostreptococcus canis]MBP1998953.1 signal transduction histidine kinase [Peptostreptococcus canis]
MSRKKAFIAAISHELKTPITVISGQLEGMIHNIGKYKDRELYLKKCYDTTQDMKFLISKMMEISRKDIFDEKSEKIEIDINGLVQNSINKHRFVYEQKNIRIITNYRNRQKIVANEEDMKTVINNIIGNAIFYSPENNTIIVTLNEKMISLSEYLVTLTVENTGVSLSKEQLKSIFEPLYRVETSRNRNTGGSGLGLYFVSQILTNHGFKYKMFSRENSTVFTIDFTPYDINYIS